MSGLEALGAVVGVVAVVAQIVSAYRDGGSIVDKIKGKRAARRGMPIPVQLEESIRDAPEDIEREKRRGLTKFGQAFEQGDYVAIIALQQIAIQVQRNLLEKLRNAHDDGTDFISLSNDADIGRINAIQVMLDLQQRLLIAAPVQSTPLFSSSPDFASRTHSQTVVGTRQVACLPPVETRSTQLLEDAHTVESKKSEQRAPRFKLFHNSKDKSNSKQRSENDRSPQPAQNGFSRVYTLPTHNDSNISVSQPAAVPTMPSSPRVTAINSPPRTHQQSLSQMTEPFHNPWAEDTRSPRESIYIQPDPTISMPLPSRASTSRSVSSTHSIPHPNPSNKYLGFCKGAWKLQDGDKTAMVVSRDYTQSAQSQVKILRCSECKFEGHFSPTTIWERVFKFEGMKIRWSFLAKSHAPQKYPLRRELAKVCDYTYQCVFCVYLGIQEPALHGAQAYQDHISQRHHGLPLNEVVLYKAGAIDDRICNDQEDFDINLYPKRSSQSTELSSRSFYG